MNTTSLKTTISQRNLSNLGLLLLLLEFNNFLFLIDIIDNIIITSVSRDQNSHQWQFSLVVTCLFWDIVVLRLVAYLLNIIYLNLIFLFKMLYMYIFVYIWHSFISISQNRNIYTTFYFYFIFYFSFTVPLNLKWSS